MYLPLNIPQWLLETIEFKMAAISPKSAIIKQHCHIFRLNTLKGKVKSSHCGPLRMNPLRDTKTAFLTAKMYDKVHTLRLGRIYIILQTCIKQKSF